MRRLSRWLVVALLPVAVIGVAGWWSRPAPARVPPARGSSGLFSCPRAVRREGLVALVTRRGLELVDLARCRASVLRAGAFAEPRFSPNGRWLAYSPVLGGNPSGLVVIPSHGGAARSPLGARIAAWTWAPRGAVLYGITEGGSLVTATPRGRRRTVATGVDTSYYGQGGPLAISPDGGYVAVDRSTCRTPTGELDTVNLRTGARTVALRRVGEFFTLAGWSPDGHWLLFWAASMCSASLAADGWPLEAVPASGGAPVRVVPHMLLYDDFLSWCRSELIAAAGPSRETQLGSRLLSVAPPAWRVRTLRSARALSWVSPACARGGRMFAAAAGVNTANSRFGIEHRSIWLLRARGGVIRRLTVPASRALSDEAPRFSRDGRWILFVRTQVVIVGETSAISHDTLELVRPTGAGGVVPILDFTSNDVSYYDHFDWPYEIDWSQSH